MEEKPDVSSVPSTEIRIACILCDVHFPRNNENEELRNHLAADHLNYRPVRCSICALEFTLHRSYLQHAAAVHEDHESNQGFFNSQPVTNRDGMLEATLESLVRLSIQKNRNGSNASAVSQSATENGAVACSLCSEDSDIFASSNARKQHVHLHTSAIRSKADVSSRRRKKTAQKRGGQLQSFWVVYAKCFPDRLRADLLEVPRENTRRTVPVKPKQLAMRLESPSTSSSTSHPKRQCTMTEENGERATEKPKRIRSLPSRFAEQSFDLPPSIDATKASKQQPVGDQHEMRPATVVLERCDYMLADYGISKDRLNSDCTLPLPVKKRRIGSCLEAIEGTLGELCSPMADSAMEGESSTLSARRPTRIPIKFRDTEPSPPGGKHDRPRKSTDSPSNHYKNLGRPKKNGKNGVQLPKSKRKAEHNKEEELLDVVSVTVYNPMARPRPVLVKRGELSGGRKDPVKGRKRSQERAQLLCCLCGEPVPRTGMFRHAVVKHLAKHLWKCSVCSFSSQLHVDVIEQHIASTHDADENAVPVDLLPDYLHTLRAFFFKCFPGKRFDVPKGKESSFGKRELPTGKNANANAVRESANVNVHPQAAVSKMRCGECRALIPCDDLKEHVVNHLARSGCFLLRCLVDRCDIRKSSKIEMIGHFRMVHPNESVSYVDESFSPEMQQKLKAQTAKCFTGAIMCRVCYEPVASGVFAVDHAWNHMFGNDMRAWRFECRSCPGRNRFSRHVFLKRHLTAFHGASEDDEASLSKAKDDLIIDRMGDFEHKFTSQWSTCYPGVAISGNNGFAYCKLCSVSMSNQQVEKHIYWHIARMFSTCRFKCRVCQMEDSDREQLAEHCMSRHPTLSKDPSSIDDQSKLRGSSLPRLFRACADKCFDAPPRCIFDHLTNRSGRSLKEVAVTKSGQQLQLSKAGSNSVVLYPAPEVNAIGNEESQTPLGEKCCLCGEWVAADDEDAHSEGHLVLSGQWKRFRCGGCDFTARTSDEVELHYDNNHFVGFSEFYERSRPSDDELTSMRQRCFYAVRSVLSEVVDRVCALIDEANGPKGDISRQTNGVEEILTCALCKAVLIGSPSVHVYSVHTGQRRFDCVHCNESYGTKQQLKGHVSLLHTDIDVDLAVKQSTDQLQTRMNALMRKCFGGNE